MERKKFLKIVNQNRPNKYTKMVYDLFGDKEFRSGLAWFLGIVFVCGFISNMLYLEKLTLLFTLIFGITLFSFVVGGFVAYVINMLRIKRICKILNISAQDYNYYARLWL